MKITNRCQGVIEFEDGSVIRCTSEAVYRIGGKGDESICLCTMHNGELAEVSVTPEPYVGYFPCPGLNHIHLFYWENISAFVNIKYETPALV